MLHRSFKPAKCKTALKLASSRVKLLKNKKQVAYNQLKREVSQLLESGQDRIARIRVEHVVREEKTMAAFELIEIYCELIVARLSMIESQKTCPIDLKEAITSVIFASPRCADIPELLDVRKHFTAKYGKEFVSSAVEMRPNCGVNRMLIEKLSGNAPDIQTKIKVLSAIAVEYNITWDPNSLEETDGKPAEDLLNGPSTFQNGNKMYAEPPNVQPPPPRDQKYEHPDVQPPLSRDQKYEQPSSDVEPPLPRVQKNDHPVNPSEHNRNPSLSSQNLTDIGGSKMVPPCGAPDPKPSRVEDEGKESEHSYSGERDDFSLGSKKWNMEFKDATDAAQAAAEAAELASMAARAAAELSTRDKITRQHSKESQKSSVSDIRDESQHNRGGSNLQSNISLKKSFHGPNSGLNHETLEGNKRDNQTEGSGRICNQSIKYTEKADEHSLMSPTGVGGLKPPSGDHYDEATEREQYKKYEISKNQDDIKTSEKEQYSKSENSKKLENIRTGTYDNSGEPGYRKQSSSASSRSHSRKFGEDHQFASTSNDSKFENEFGHDLFVGMDRENIQTDTEHPKYDSGADDDDGVYDLEDKYSRPESMFFTSLDRNLPVYPSSTYSLIPERKSTSQSHLFKEPPVEISENVSKIDTIEPADLMPVTFDHSDGPSSGSEEEVNHRSPMRRKSPMDSGYMDPKYLHHESGETKSQKSSKKIWVHEFHSDGPSSESEEELANHRSSLRGKTPMGSGDKNKKKIHGEFDEIKSRKSSKEISVHEFKSNVQTEETPHHMKYDEFPKQSILDNSKQLNLGGLTGGNRNKGFRSLPYTRGQSSEVSSPSKSEIEDFPVTPNQKMSTKKKKKSYYKVPETSSDSDSDDFNEETGLTGGNRNKGFSSLPYTRGQSSEVSSPSKSAIEDFPVTQDEKMSTQKNKKSYYKVPETSSDSDSDDFNEETAKQKISPTFSNFSSSKLQGTYFDSDYDEKKDMPDPSKGRLGGVSRRTKGSFTRPKVSADSISSDYDSERRTSKFSHPTEKPSPPRQTTSKPRSEVYEKASFSNVKASEEGSLSFGRRTSKFSHATERPNPESKNSLQDERLRTSSKAKVSEESDHISERRPSKFSLTTEKPSSPKHTTSKHKPESHHSFHEERSRPSVFDKPTSVFEKPTSAFEKPTSVFNKPASAFEKPTSAFEKPTSVFNKPASAFEKPTSAFEKPTSAFEKPSSFSGRTESPETPSSSEKIVASENSLNKPSHVHPKLPDYDSFAAHFESLRSNQK